MTIGNGSTILKVDLDAMITASLALVQADNARLALGFIQRFEFPNLVTSTSAERRKAIFVAPCDCLLESLIAETVDHTAASTLTVNVFGDGALAAWPQAPAANSTQPFISVSGSVGAGQTKPGRKLRDNTKTHPFVGAVATQAFMPLLRGQTITIVPSTTSVATPSQTRVTLSLREYFSRD